LHHNVISDLFSFAKFEINESCRRKLRFKDNALRNKKAAVLEYVYGGLDAIVDAAITGREKDFLRRVRQRRACAVTGGNR